MPVRMCWTPSFRYVPATDQPPGRSGMVVSGSFGVSRPTQVVPSANSIRTSASVMVAESPSMRSSRPRSGSRRRSFQVCTAAEPVRRVASGTSSSLAPESTGASESRMSPTIGVFQSTSSSPAADSCSSR